MFCPHLRSVVMCDADNIEIRRRGEPRRHLELPRLAEILRRLLEASRQIYYRPNHGFPKSYEAAVKEVGFEVRRTPKNSDAWLICDAIAFAKKYERIVFVGGDGDLVPVVLLLKSMGVRVDVWGWRLSTSEHLKAIVDNFVALDDLDIDRAGPQQSAA